MSIKEKIMRFVKAQGNQVGSGAELGEILDEMVDSMPGPPGPQGPQGPQGNTGSSVDYPYELVNNLTTDDPEKGLSAAQGVVLKGEISQLGQKVDELADDFLANKITTYNTPEAEVGLMRPTGVLDSSETSYRVVRPIALNPGEKIDLNLGNDLYVGVNVAALFTCDSQGNLIETIEATQGVKKVSYTNSGNSIIYVGTSTYTSQRSYRIVAQVRASSVEATLCGWIIGSIFLPKNASYTDGVINSPVNIVWPDGVSGTITIVRNGDGLVTQVIAEYGSDSYIMAITRDSNGNATNVELEKIN